MNRRDFIVAAALVATSAPARATPKIARVQLHIPKWSCGSCTIETCAVLGKLPGVERLISRIRSKHLFIVYDPTKTDEAKLIAAIKGVGYDAAPDPEATWPILDAKQTERVVHLH